MWITCHIGAFCFDARQFGAFHFGDFHFDAVPVRRVSLWRASTSARFSLARFHFGAFLFGAFLNFVRTYDDPVSANASFARTVSFLRRNAFYASLARISFCVAYLFALMFPICEEVFSTPVWRVSRFCAYVDRICEYGIGFSVFCMCGSLFCVFFLYVSYCPHHLVINVSSRPHHIILY